MSNKKGFGNNFFGFLFKLGAEGLSDSDTISPKFVSRHRDMFNEDGMAVSCEEHGQMDYYEGNTLFDSYWVCPVCGQRVEAIDVYGKLQEENDTLLNELDIE